MTTVVNSFEPTAEDLADAALLVDALLFRRREVDPRAARSDVACGLATGVGIGICDALERGETVLGLDGSVRRFRAFLAAGAA